jgi:protein-tyrosine phosphatase
MTCCSRKSIINFFASIIQDFFTWSMQSAAANEILPGLWLGNRHASKDRDFLEMKNIGAIFNCTKDLPFPHNQNQHLYRVPVDDNLQQDEIRNLALWAWEIIYKVHKERVSGNRILVHCAAGMQRSAAVVAMYLISQYRCTTDEAIAFIKAKRPIAFYGNANFYESIKAFEKSLQRMIREKNAYESMPRIPLPIDTITNT